MGRILKRSALRMLCTSAASYRQAQETSAPAERALGADKKARAGRFACAEVNCI